jgi:hypothetical protein
MSVSLSVWLKRPLTLIEIKSSASVALRELLNLDRDPLVSARIDMSPRSDDFSTELLGENSKHIVCSGGVLSGSFKRAFCSVEEHEEQVRIRAYSVPVQVPTADGSYLFADQIMATIEWYRLKTPLCFALSAGVTLGLARLLDSEIIDTAAYFTISIESAPDDFCRTLRLSTRQADLKSAAEAFYARMSKSIEMTHRCNNRRVGHIQLGSIRAWPLKLRPK